MEREGSSSYANYLTRIANNTFPSHLLRAQREWESRPPKSPTAEIHLHGCAGDQIFGERLRDCSRDLFVQLLRSQLAVRRLPELTRAVVLLPGDRSRDCTAYIFLHRLRTATSNKHTRCLV
jgi:DNA-directed RNA polymerase specialized sigma24 family protein